MSARKPRKTQSKMRLKCTQIISKSRRMRQFNGVKSSILLLTNPRSPIEISFLTKLSVTAGTHLMRVHHFERCLRCSRCLQNDTQSSIRRSLDRSPLNLLSLEKPPACECSSVSSRLLNTEAAIREVSTGGSIFENVDNFKKRSKYPDLLQVRSGKTLELCVLCRIVGEWVMHLVDSFSR